MQDRAHSGIIANLKLTHLASHRHDFAHNLMTGHHRIDWTPMIATHSVQIAMADSSIENLNKHIIFSQWMTRESIGLKLPFFAKATPPATFAPVFKNARLLCESCIIAPFVIKFRISLISLYTPIYLSLTGFLIKHTS